MLIFIYPNPGCQRPTSLCPAFLITWIRWAVVLQRSLAFTLTNVGYHMKRESYLLRCGEPAAAPQIKRNPDSRSWSSSLSESLEFKKRKVFSW